MEVLERALIGLETNRCRTRAHPSRTVRMRPGARTAQIGLLRSGAQWQAIQILNCIRRSLRFRR